MLKPVTLNLMMNGIKSESDSPNEPVQENESKVEHEIRKRKELFQEMKAHHEMFSSGETIADFEEEKERVVLQSFAQEKDFNTNEEDLQEITPSDDDESRKLNHYNDIITDFHNMNRLCHDGEARGNKQEACAYVDRNYYGYSTIWFKNGYRPCNPYPIWFHQCTKKHSGGNCYGNANPDFVYADEKMAVKYCSYLTPEAAAGSDWIRNVELIGPPAWTAKCPKSKYCACVEAYDLLAVCANHDNHHKPWCYVDFSCNDSNAKPSYKAGGTFKWVECE
jgi:hypothetical protein